MAWPLTPLTTYLPRSLPPIKAADLMAIQSAINRAFLGTYSYQGLVLDGVGGNDASPPAGGLSAAGSGSFGGDLSIDGAATVGRNASVGQGLAVREALVVGGGISAGGSLKIGGSATAQSAPTPAISKGEMFADSLVVAFGVVLSNGTLRAGFGIKSVQAFPPSGVYDLTLYVSASDAFSYVPIACGYNGANSIVTASGIAGDKVRVFTSSQGASTGNTTPKDFCIAVFAV